MIATLRHRLIRGPARLIRHTHRLELRLSPTRPCATRSSPTSAPCPGPTAPDLRNPPTRGDTRVSKLSVNQNPTQKDQQSGRNINDPLPAELGLIDQNFSVGQPNLRCATTAPTCALSRAVAHGHEQWKNVTSGVKATSDLASPRQHQSCMNEIVSPQLGSVAATACSVVVTKQ